MLKKLDRYILGKFLSTFVFTILIFSMIAAIIDFSEKIEKFIETPITAKEIWIDYYPNFIMFINGLLWPLFTLIAVIFFTSRLAYNSEIISIFNAGVSFRRLLYPYLLGATFIAILHFIGNHYVIPNGNNTMLNIVHQYIHTNEDKGQTQDVHLFISPDTKVYVKSYYKADSSIREFRIEQFEANELVYYLKANSAKWLPKKEKWRLNNYEIRKFNDMEEDFIIGRGKQMDTTINLRPADFVDYLNQHTMMNTPLLKSYIQKQKSRGVGNVQKYEIELYRRSAEPFTIIILTLIGVPIAARKVRGGLGLHLALGIGIGAMFIFLSRFAIVFASGQSIPILVGIWMPNLVFLIIALYLVSRAQR
jgi:lipopolysaccharide export system permease protein